MYFLLWLFAPKDVIFAAPTLTLKLTPSPSPGFFPYFPTRKQVLLLVLEATQFLIT